ncbi:hypothetical protein SAMN06298216_2094 [Spirosomataceae bacterium TFI 002]|nr:hypothetical protein SAMN06298216_2094 [Spirosomataceae bacterium TFI 002]
MKKQFLTIITGFIAFVFTSCERSEIQPTNSGDVPKKIEVIEIGPKEFENTNDLEPLKKVLEPEIAPTPIISFKVEE